MKLPRRDVFLKLFRQSWPALVIAVLWGFVALYNHPAAQRSAAVFVGGFASAFFFLGWLMSQYLRVEKHIDDATQYGQLQSGIDDVKASIRALHKKRAEDVKSFSSSSLMEEATQTVEAGRTLPGLLLAGVAFEEAVRERASREGLDVSPRTPTYRLINELRGRISSNVLAELHPLLKLRNQLAHITFDAAQELAQRPELIKNFQWAVGELAQPSNNSFNPTGHASGSET